MEFKLSSSGEQFNFKFFAGTAILALCCILIFYYAFLKQLLLLPYPLSYLESLYLWVIEGHAHKLFIPDAFQQAPLFNDFSESLAYPGFITSLMKMMGSPSNVSSNNILMLGRILSTFSVGLSTCFFFALLKKEKVNTFVAAFACMLFLSLPLTQSIAYQARPEAFAMMLGILGIYLFFVTVKHITSLSGLAIGICLALPYIFSHKLSFLGFALCCAPVLVVSRNWATIFKLYFPFFLAILLDLSFNIFVLGFRGIYPFNFNVWLGNLEILFAWPLIALIICFFYCKPLLEGIKINAHHPVVLLFAFALLITSFFSGTQVDSGPQWIVFLLSLCWGGALFINQFKLQATSSSVFSYLSVLSVFLCTFVPLLKPLPYKLLSENPQIISQRTDWVRRERALVLSTYRNSEEDLPKVLSSDLSLARDLGGLTIFSDPNLLYASDAAKKQAEKIITEQTIDLIILGEFPRRVWPNSLLKTIKKHYSPVREIFINGGEGLVYEADSPKINKEYQRQQIKLYMQQSEQKIFATFHKI